MEKAVYNVSGLSSQTIKTQMCNAISKVDGVRQVGIDLESGDVEVRFKSPATEALIVNKIQSTGHKVNGSLM